MSLGVPRPRGPRSVFDGLLSPFGARREGGLFGSPVVSASRLLGDPAGNEPLDLGRVVVDLDLDPARLRGPGQVSYEAVRFDVTCDDDALADALGLRVPAPLVVFARGDDAPAEYAERIAAACRVPGLLHDRPVQDGPIHDGSVRDGPVHDGPVHDGSVHDGEIGRIADFLSVVAHTEGGFVARVGDGPRALSLVAGTVAALRGDDVRAALAAPDVRVLTALGPDAAAAVREVLLAIEITDPSGLDVTDPSGLHLTDLPGADTVIS
nr:hypothetical protein [Rhodococcus sp. HNM0569]